MATTRLTFASREEHRAWLASQSTLPRGFRVGTARTEFVPAEAPKRAKLDVTVIALDRPTPAFAAMFTKNAFPGAPIAIGRKRLGEDALSAIVVNNKVSNVCAEGGVEAAERVCACAAELLGRRPSEVLPSSTGVIGWRLPEAAIVEALPRAVASLQAESVLPAADGIMTTDLYAKVRRAQVGAGSIVGIAKGAGMIEPNLATMLVYLLTDLDVPREELRAALPDAVDATFHRMSIDTDTSTSDTIALLSSGAVPCPDRAAFRAALRAVCADLTEDVVRNGEGVHHVMRVTVSGARDEALARAIGKSIVSSPLFQCAVAGNDPNVGRLVMAIGKHASASGAPLDPSRVSIRMAGRTILERGIFRLDHDAERALVAHLRDAELYASVPPPDGLTFRPPVTYPAHERAVEIEVALGQGDASCTVLGADRTHEYVSENADYRT